MCVGNDDDVRSVVLGPSGALAGMKPGSILVDHTTASAEIARELFDAAKKSGFDFVDAPVSGGQAGAENGQLTVMCGGDQGPFDKANPVAMSFAKAITLIGPSGSGQITKMMNQMCIAGSRCLGHGVPRERTCPAKPHPRATRQRWAISSVGIWHKERRS